MTRLHQIATFFIAAYALCTGAGAEEVYKCGNAYSQKPCPGAVLVDVQDARTAAQKAQADANTRHEMAQVQALEKAHQKEEAQRRAAQAKLAAAEQKKAAPKPGRAASAADTADASAPLHKKKSKKGASGKAKNAPETFVASVPADKNRPASAAGKGK